MAQVLERPRVFSKSIKNYVTQKLLEADIQINGPRPWDIHVLNEDFFSRLFYHRSLGLGESYMDGWIECAQIDQLIYKLCRANLGNSTSLNNIFIWLTSLIRNPQSKQRALIVGRKHYDLSPRLFECMLDKRMIYSCAYWKNATNLEKAQEAKLDLICQKLYLKPGMKILDIGCGWGGLAKFAAENYAVKVVGITISQEQLALAKEKCKGFPIELRFQDYRDIKETFDAIVSVGQMEHVGNRNYREYMRIVHRSLKTQGLFLLHTIGRNTTAYSTDRWTQKYIFPNGMLPSPTQLIHSSENLFILEDWHNFGPDYEKTLLTWFHNFDMHWEELSQFYDNRFYRMWKYYLLSCAGAFRAREIQLWQIIFSKGGIPGGYQSIR